MKLIQFFCLIIIVLQFTNCIPESSTNQRIGVCEDKSDSAEAILSTITIDEVRSICSRLAHFRDQLVGIDDPRVFDEVLLRKSVGGYGYEELLYIVRRYGQEVGHDAMYEKCVKYLYLFNDGEYSGAIEDIIPDTKSEFEGKSQVWLLTS